MRRDPWIQVALLLAILAAYAQVYSFDFVNYDDQDYVTRNLHVRAGLTAPGVDWAFHSTEYANWLPLSWLSHMVDVEFYGLNPGRHHLTNVALHALSTLLLFALLLRITGNRWPSAFVAFIFALHPLHVESVAWIAERKDVLCGLFYILALWAYVLYVDRPGPLRYAALLILFACGIIAKPMIVTLPFVALLLDYWPLQRLSKKAVLEKIPLFALSAAASVIAFLVQRHGGAVSTLTEIPVTLRIENAAVAYVTYIFQFFWPAKLAVFYPFPAAIPAWEWIAALAFLAAITAFALRSRPVAVGWLWFLGTLVPVIGLVKIGLQSHADRYTYIPLIGLAIALAWGVKYKIPIALWACAICAATFIQVSTWRTSTSLFEHALAVTEGNYLAHNDLGVALRQAGRRSEALSHFEEALRLQPKYPEAQSNLGEVLLVSGRFNEALPHIGEALRLDPSLPEAHINLGALRNKQGRPDQAEPEYRAALQLNPASAEAHDGLAVVLTETNRPEEALRAALDAIALNPEYADAHYNLGRLYGLTGRPDLAVEQFRETVRLEPTNAEAHFNLGTAYAQTEHMNEAIAEFSAAIHHNPDYASAHFNLASALARQERYDEALAEFTESLRLNPSQPGAREALDYCRTLRK